MVTGRVECRYGEWDFRWQALTCDESAHISAWLRAVADWLESTPGPPLDPRRHYTGPGDLRFTEPNLMSQRSQASLLGGAGSMEAIRIFTKPPQR